MTESYEAIENNYHSNLLMLGKGVSKQEASPSEILDKVFTRPRLMPTCLLTYMKKFYTSYMTSYSWGKYGSK